VIVRGMRFSFTLRTMRYSFGVGGGRSTFLFFSAHFCLCIALDDLAWCLYPLSFLLFHFTVSYDDRWTWSRSLFSFVRYRPTSGLSVDHSLYLDRGPIPNKTPIPMMESAMNAHGPDNRSWYAKVHLTLFASVQDIHSKALCANHSPGKLRLNLYLRSIKPLAQVHISTCHHLLHLVRPWLWPGPLHASRRG
jgi:hypothetical protein